MLLPICFLEAMMETELEVKIQTEQQITVEDVNRVLEVGRLLYSGITPEEDRSPHRAIFKQGIGREHQHYLTVFNGAIIILMRSIPFRKK